MSLRVSLGLVVGLAVVGLSPAAAEPEAAPAGQAVVALFDTGINPYHVEFRDDSPLAWRHPSTYLEGFPADAEAVPLTFDAASYQEALAADCETWAGMETGKLYWFPGTKIVGAVSFRLTTPTCEDGQLRSSLVLDYHRHGTMVASRAAANSFGACPDCRIVAIQATSVGGGEETKFGAMGFAYEHRGWIDVLSHAWAPAATPVYLPVDHPFGGLAWPGPEFVRQVEKVSAAMPTFWASGNGVADRLGVAGHPTLLQPRATPSTIMVGGHDSGYVNLWPGFPPHLVSDSCDSWGARHQSLDSSGERVAGGTSASTPFVAGGAARLMAYARMLLGDTRTGQREGGVLAAGDPGGITAGPLADGVLTREEWQRVLYTTATDRPVAQYEDGPPCPALNALFAPTPIQWTDVPDGYPEYLHIGYGAVDDPALTRAFAVLRGEADLPDRSATDEYFATHHTIGDTTHHIYTLPDL